MKWLSYVLATALLLVFLATGAASANEISYTYDRLNRLTGVAYPDGTQIEYIYDEVGNILIRNVIPASGSQASFSASPASGPMPLAVSFTDQSTGTVNSWSWNFGEGGSSTSQNPVHTYSSVGTYTVILTVCNSSGSSSYESTIKVGPPLPVASFTASPTSGMVPLSVSFTDSSTGGVTGWSWSFGDGGTSTSQNPSHTYTNPGTYNVTLVVTGPTGTSDPKIASIAVIAYYMITSSAGPGGSISPVGTTTVNGGTSATFTITPSMGNIVSDVTVDGSSVGALSSYTFNNVTAPHSISAVFASTVTVSAGPGGSISPSGTVTLNCGTNQSFSISPSSGYFIVAVQVDGVSQGPISSYTFTDVTASHTLSAIFAQNGPVMNARTYATYSSLQEAYDAASDEDTILAQNLVFTENFTADRSISVTMVGGYDSSFSSNPNKTTIQGSPVINSGTVTLNNFVISN